MAAPTGESSADSSTSTRRGVVYLVAGPRSYLGEFSTSLKGLRRHNPDLPVTVYSPYAIPRRLVADHVEYTSTLHPLQQKVDILRRSPYRETLFLDTDTNILGPIDDIFDRAAAGNFALAKAYRIVSTNGGQKRVELEHPEEFNTGVLCFDSSDVTNEFLDLWFETLCTQDPTNMWPGHNGDQACFNRLVANGALEQFGVALVTVPNVVYNARGAMADELKRRGLWDSVRIFHHRTRWMKARKARYSLTDRAHIADTGRRVVGKLRNQLRRWRRGGSRQHV